MARLAMTLGLVVALGVSLLDANAAIAPPPTRYLLYNPTLGSLNNQLGSLISAAVVADDIGATLVLNPA
eukprot:CAMPEP_0198349472 /NCGR_PEP_ID=MMETSP1450-20131203/94215_1 /TAXON_ID=753684 ORGANISM="Madagascaria erythrocladiodes, Strain CCMP3234" /NCGR_SAMPLE_ID=MMETSP1450 /ASSEMBLY_ACC=CAM_ASM_001115 /LENGTH=68 /DNA_ID=CAMNT_0044055151 /DNA_START=18 /DNA_END=220 /DNA_ORIENTATION=-